MVALPWYPLNRIICGPHSRSDHVWRSEKSLVSEMETRIVQPSHYTQCASAAPKRLCYTHETQIRTKIFVYVPEIKSQRKKFSSFRRETGSHKSFTTTAACLVGQSRRICRIWKGAAVMCLRVEYSYVKKFG